MVGTRRTNSCDTCRKRRVKCDEVRPVCGPCAKKRRECLESPAPDFVWVKHGQRTVPRGVVSGNSPSALPGVSPDVAAPWALVRKKPVANGASFHKYRLGVQRVKMPDRRLLRQPTVTPLDRLRDAFRVAYREAPQGYCLHEWSHRYDFIPQYLGESEVLDSAVTFLIEVHSRNTREQVVPHSIGALYIKALGLLQKALDEDRQEHRAFTLCAISFLSWAEGLQKAPNMNYVTHQSGVATFIKHHGMSLSQSDLGRAVMYSCGGAIFIDAVVNGREAFMANPEWDWLTVQRCEDTCAFRRLHNRTVWHLHRILSILESLRKMEGGQILVTSDAHALWNKCLDLKSSIGSVKARLDTLIWSSDSRSVSHRAATGKDTPEPNVYWYESLRIASTAASVWAIVIYINNILFVVRSHLPDGPEIPGWPATAQKETQAESMDCAIHISRSVEYAQTWAPIGASFMSFPLIIAWTVLDKQRDWLVRSLNVLGKSPFPLYSGEFVAAFAGLFFGTQRSLEELVTLALTSKGQMQPSTVIENVPEHIDYDTPLIAGGRAHVAQR